VTVSSHRDLADRHGLMNYVPDGRLFLAGEPISSWVSRIGTPALVGLPARAAENVDWYQQAFTRGHSPTHLHYAVKASYDLDLCRAIVARGAGLEVMSARELDLARTLGISGDRLVINGIGRSVELTRRAIRERPRLLVVDSDEDLCAAVQVSRAERRVVPIALRLAMSGSGSRLGLGHPEELMRVLDVVLAEPFLTPAGILYHALHVATSHSAVQRHVAALVDVCLEVHAVRGWSFEYVDIGGGLAGRLEIEAVGGLDPLAAAAARELQRLPYAPALVVEPGRALVADAVVGLGRLVARKQRPDVMWGISDLGTNALVPVAGSAFLPTAAFWPVDAELVTFQLGDQSCSESTLGPAVELPDGTKDVVFLQAGAYTDVFAHAWGPDLPRPHLVPHLTSRST